MSPDVRIARVDPLRFAFAQIDTGHMEAGLCIFNGKGKAYIAQSDDADMRALRPDFLR